MSDRAAEERRRWKELKQLVDAGELQSFHSRYAEYLEWNGVYSFSRALLVKAARMTAKKIGEGDKSDTTPNGKDFFKEIIEFIRHEAGRPDRLSWPLHEKEMWRECCSIFSERMHQLHEKLSEQWSSEPPSSPGFYWFRKCDNVRMVSVFNSSGKLYTNEDGGAPVSDSAYIGGEWCGPIDPPSRKA